MLKNPFSGSIFAKTARDTSSAILKHALLLGIMAYFSGWNYVNSYFSEFNINKSSLEFPDYTVILYSFFVLEKIPLLIISPNVSSAIGLLLFCFALIVAAAAFPLLNSIRVSLATILAFFSLFLISSEAGNKDAQRVLSGAARPVQVYLDGDFFDGLGVSMGDAYADLLKKSIRNSADLGALVIIWRNSAESIFLMFETAVGPTLGEPVEILRVPNEYVVLISSQPIRG